MLSLLQHPSITMFGEVFHDDLRERRTDFAAGRTRKRYYRDGEDGAAFLREHVFFNGGDPASANGCKIFYEHARRDRAARTVWDYLVADRDIKVIHLIRSNLFDCAVSHERAKRSGESIRLAGRDGSSPAPAPFRLEPAWCHGYFESTTCWIDWAKTAFAQHDVLELSYERDLGADFDGTMDRVYDFLGVARRATRVPTVIQRSRSASRQISNYAELKDYFRNTSFARFFRR